jgi:Icc-related predicted phosphoesterase
MRLALLSDLHGHLPDVPPCDMLLIAGDVCPIDNHKLDYQADWLRYHFVPWFRDAPCREKVFIAGNHDFIFAERPEALYGIEWPGIYLQDRGCVCEGISIWGTPWANELPGWPFTAPEEVLQRYWDMIPPDTKILMVHGPAHGIGDAVIGNLSGDVLHVGSRSLLETFDRLPALRLVVFGHIHEGSGIYQHNGLTLVNAAVMDEQYYPVNPVRIVEMEF